MRNTSSRISDAMISFLGRTGILGLPIPSPTTLLVTLILGPALLMALHTVHVPAVFADTGDVAVARGYEDDLWLKCKDSYVSEGDDFRLEVRRKGLSFSSSPTMRVDWYTDPGTADESDYSPLHAERQASNGYQSRTGIMGRTFHTTEDSIREQDETFTVRFENTVENGDDGACAITIIDDDW